MRNVMIAAGLAAGMGVAQAAVLLYPGNTSVLGTASGSALIAAVAWDGTDLVSVVVALSGPYGYVMNASTDSVVTAMSDAGVGHFDISPVGVGTYYLVLSDSTPDPLIPGPVQYQSEDFTLALIPESGTYGLIAGLGLVGFAAYRRFQG